MEYVKYLVLAIILLVVVLYLRIKIKKQRIHARKVECASAVPDYCRTGTVCLLRADGSSTLSRNGVSVDIGPDTNNKADQ
ncbi:hypothetical protein GCM10025791_11390 [Halioxenophilus aromaticivorans]|uniref:Uncharacterized protein n=1 Tax=Halioxenophilus aromaticivorans TaxID=1306992 RepID=A0AAV3TZA0_9ALTE